MSIDIEAFGADRNAADNTAAIVAAMNTGERIYGHPNKEYKIQTPALGITGDFIAEDLNLVWDGDANVIFQFSGNVQFFNCHARELVQSGKTGQNRMFQCNGSALFHKCTTLGFGTAFHCLQGEVLEVIHCSSKDIRGFDPQNGYGVNSSAKRTIVYDYDFRPLQGSHGRHAVYINGTDVDFFSLRDIYVDSNYLNPINIRTTSTTKKVVGFIDGVEMFNCFTASGDEPLYAAAINVSNPSSEVVPGCVKISRIFSSGHRGGLVRIYGYPDSSICDITARNFTAGTNNIHLIKIDHCNRAYVNRVSVNNGTLNFNGNIVDVEDSREVSVSSVRGNVLAGDATVRFHTGVTDSIGFFSKVTGMSLQSEDTTGVNTFKT